MPHYKRVAQLRTVEQFREYQQELGIDLPFDEEMLTAPESPLAQTFTVRDFTMGNRWCILPMEGWDGTADGHPSELTVRRWRNFGISGAKLIWGGEAIAVRHDGRANPHQVRIGPDTVDSIRAMREALVKAHEERFGGSDDLLVGIQLTHSGRFCRPNEWKKTEPQILYRHPVLDRKFGIDSDSVVMSDDDIARLIEDFISAAKLAQQAGFTWVDLKHCHGYLGHEFLSAYQRPGKYGGSFENRTRFLRELVEGIRAEVPGMDIGVRLSAFDWIPFRPGGANTGEPEPYQNGSGYPFAFGGDGTGTGIDLTEPFQFLDLLAELDIPMVCITAGSPYYVPHIQRPALFPPSDGYEPPEDPLVGVARQIQATAKLKAHSPNLLVAGTGYSYLQEWLPNVAQHVVRTGMVDFVGLGRMVLSYPELPADVLAGNKMQRKKFCRTFSDCTTAPRNALPSGCYPLDEFYKNREEAEKLAAIKQS